MNEENKREYTDNEMIAFGLKLMLPAILIILFLTSFRAVKAGTVRVITRFGGTTGRVLSPGANFIIPLFEKTKVLSTKFMLYETMSKDNIKKSESDYKQTPVDTNTKDGQRVDIFYTIRFAIDPDKAVWVVNNFGSEANLVDKLVRAESRSMARIIPSKFSANQLYVGKGKEEVASLIFDAIEKKLADNGIILDSVLIREIQFEKDYIQAIEDKQIAAVRVETEANIASQSAFRKQARITEAEGKAEEQRLQKETLSAQVLEKTQLDVQQTMAEALKISAEKGVKIVPDTVLGDGQGLFYQLAK